MTVAQTNQQIMFVVLIEIRAEAGSSERGVYTALPSSRLGAWIDAEICFGNRSTLVEKREQAARTPNAGASFPGRRTNWREALGVRPACRRFCTVAMGASTVKKRNVSFAHFQRWRDFRANTEVASQITQPRLAPPPFHFREPSADRIKREDQADPNQINNRQPKPVTRRRW